jgi:ATP-dependent Lhr-like helicase
MRALPAGSVPATLVERYGLDGYAAANLAQYITDQVEAAGAVPDDRTVVVERFRDEIGDWRVCILTPFGTPVHAPWAMAIERRLTDRYGMPVETMWSDDGIVLRLPEAVDEIPSEDFLIDPDEIDELVVSTLPQTSLFASRFRECAARALLLPRRRPDSRTPLWQQRQRAADLLAVAAKYPTFPILLETTRECLQDVFDVPALREVLRDLRARRIRMVAVETPKASPFAQSLLFNWIAAYMYEGDAPLAERRAAALALDRDLLRELLGAEELRELIDPDVLADLELELQCLADHRRARTLDELHDLLRRLGDLNELEIDVRVAEPGAGAGWIARLVSERRAIAVMVAGEARYAAADDAARYRDALGVSLPLGLPTVFTDPVEHPLESLVARYARTHGPFHADAVARRFGSTTDRVTGALRALETEGKVVRGEFRPGGVEREWCDNDVLRQLRRRSLAALRREVEPVEPAAFARFLPEWQGISAPGSDRAGGRRGVDGVVEALSVLQGAAIPASVLDSDVLSARVSGYRPADLDALCTSGDVVWIGAGGIGSSDGRVRLFFRDRLAVLAGGIDVDERPTGVVHDALRTRLVERGASFWHDLVAAAPSVPEAELLAALWDLVWSGEITNDSLAPLRAFVAGGRPGRGNSRPRGRPRPGRLTRLGPPAAAGRWSLVAPLLEPPPTITEAAHARALQLLERHGVLTREAVNAEGVEGGFSAVYGVLKVLEERGQVRRGYFVAGLGAAQFALPGAVDRLRAVREVDDDDDHRPLVLAATDPAQPYGAALAWPEANGRPARAAGALVVLRAGEAQAWLDRRAHSLVVFSGGADGEWIESLVQIVKDGRVRSIELRRIDGEPITSSPWVSALRSGGFADGYRGLVLRG